VQNALHVLTAYGGGSENSQWIGQMAMWLSPLAFVVWWMHVLGTPKER